MIFVFAVIAVFVIASIYFFFRAEALQREVLTLKRDINKLAKENKAMIASMVIVASRFEEFAKQRFSNIKTMLESQSQNEDVLQQLQVISPIINNYAIIYRECSKGSGQLKTIAKKCFESFEKGSFKEFVSFVNKQDKQVKKMWASNNLNGFISLVEALLSQQEEKLLKDAPVKKLKKVS